MNLKKNAAEQKMEALRLALLRQGAATEIWIYTGSLRKLLKRMEDSHSGSFAVLHARKESVAEQLVRPILSCLGLSLTNNVAKASLAFSSGVQSGSWAGTNEMDVNITRSEKLTNS
jgi:hypothetical protein